MVYENTGGVPNVMTTTGRGDGDYAQQSWWWVFALVLIFLALIFLWGRGHDNRREHYGEGLLPAMAMMNCQKPKHDNDYYAWDHARDFLKDSGEIKMEIKETAWQQSREQDKYNYEQRAALERGFYEQRAGMDKGFFEQARLTDQNRYDTLLGFKNSEILGLQNTREIIGRVDGLERRLDQDIIRKQGEELNYLKTVMALSPRPIPPSYPVHPPSPYPPFAYDGCHNAC